MSVERGTRCIERPRGRGEDEDGGNSIDCQLEASENGIDFTYKVVHGYDAN